MTGDVLALLGDGWTYERHLAGGAVGAVLARRPNGSLAVIKLSNGIPSVESQRVAFVRRLRGAGYPTPHEDEPRMLADGNLACVTDFVADAEPVEALTEPLVQDLLALAETQAGLVPGATGWPDWLCQSLSAGFEDWCRPSVVRADPRCADIAERAVALSGLAAALPEGGDLIHGDLHQGNLLARGGRLTAVIDCGAVRPGDRWFDLVTALIIAAPGPVTVRQVLRDVVELQVPERALAVYVAHLGVRLLDWALTWAPGTVEFWVTAVSEEFDRYRV